MKEYIKSFKYKLTPTTHQSEKMQWTLDRCRELYNAGLEERITAYKKAKVSVGYHAQAVSLPGVKEARPEYKDIYSQVLQDVLKRLDKTYQGFFRRKRGFPRFQGNHRFNSFTYPQHKAQINQGKVYLPKIGDGKIRLSRPLQGKVKTCTVKKEIDGWYAVFSCEVEITPLPKTGNTIGLDFGLTDIVATSDGELIKAPKYFSKTQRALAKAQRQLARRKKGSNRRNKARVLVAKLHQKVTRQRADFLHKLSTHFIKENDVIAIEDLNISGLSKDMLAKSFLDVGLGSLTQMFTYKAEWAGRPLVKVNPNHTSQDCSTCGYRKKHPLWVRSFTCKECGTMHHRDTNAAMNIKARSEPSWRNAEVVNSYVPRESHVL